MQKTIRTRQVVTVAALGVALSLTCSAQSMATTISETPGNYSRDTVVTGPNGRTATSNTTASWAPGSTSRETTVTGFNGKTATYQDNRSWGNGAYTNAKSYTGVNGRTATDTVTRSGGVVSNTFTGPNGNSRTYTHLARRRR